jgi:hypothetical protein
MQAYFLKWSREGAGITRPRVMGSPAYANSATWITSVILPRTHISLSQKNIRTGYKYTGKLVWKAFEQTP